MAFLGNFLRVMLIVSVFLLCSGGLLFLVGKGHEKISYHEFDKETVVVGNGMPLMKSGLALLALTPLLTMFLCLIVFGSQRDFLYMILTLLVMIILSYSLSMGH